MNATTENQLFKIWHKVATKTDCASADRIIEPLKWYIVTGRCSGAFVKAFNKLTGRQLTTISNRLIKADFGDYETIITSITEYIDKVTKAA